MKSIQIPRCYDSHSHVLATGQLLSMLSLRGLKDPRDVGDLKLEPKFNRGDWLLGFGWDQHLFPNGEYPTRAQLDTYFPNRPVAFSRTDGHAVWVNTCALEICDLLRPVASWNLPSGAEAFKDANGLPTGILIDRAMELIFAHIPQDSLVQKKSDLLEAFADYNRKGFTHVRDMSGDESQWQALCELEDLGQMTMYLDQNFVFEKPEDFSRALDLARRAKAERHRHLCPRGLKFYIDGALGSEGALLSRHYPGTSSYGLQIWSLEQITSWIREAWSHDLEVSVHALGDQASFLLAQAARSVWETGQRGILNIEHAEVVRPETFEILRGIPTVFHMQPCHWNSDRLWLRSKLGELYQYAFPWAKAREQGFSVLWGSDAPIEEPSLFANEFALNQSKGEGIPAFPLDWWQPHSHPHMSWGADCATEISDGTIKRVLFDGELIIG